MKIQGRVWKFKDNIDTDVIIPARYLVTHDAKELGAHCMEDADRFFVRKVRPGDIIVAGKNFGCGSSREHAPLAIKGCGIACVIAENFARIFFRNAINIGLPIFESKVASQDIKEGDTIEIDMNTGTITNLTRKAQYTADSFPKFMQEIMKAGGLLAWIHSKKLKIKD